MTASDRNNGPTTEGRNSDGTFAAGNPGRPRGARHKTTLAIEALLDGQGEALTEKLIELALDGDATALRLCIERIAPTRKDSLVAFELPDMASAEDAATASASILKSVSLGELTPGEGAQVMALIDSYRRTLEVTELEGRIAALENQK